MSIYDETNAAQSNQFLNTILHYTKDGICLGYSEIILGQIIYGVYGFQVDSRIYGLLDQRPNKEILRKLIMEGVLFFLNESELIGVRMEKIGYGLDFSEELEPPFIYTTLSQVVIYAAPTSDNAIFHLFEIGTVETA